MGIISLAPKPKPVTGRKGERRLPQSKPSVDSIPENPSNTFDQLRNPLASDPQPLPKLEIGDTDDPLEREADQIADEVMRPSAWHPRKNATFLRPAAFSGNPRFIARHERRSHETEAREIHRSCASCSAEDEELRRDPSPGQRGGVASDGFANRVRTRVRQGGASLPSQARDFIEPRLRVGLGGIRVHSDPEAGSLAREINARAFTLGQDIFFAPGQLQLQTPTGMRLVAHEIAHTVHAGPAGGAAHLATPIRRSSADDLVSSMDKTAEAVLDDVVAGSFYTSNEFEERIRKLSSSERRRLREMMTSQSFMDQEIVDELIKVLDNVIAGHIGGTVGHVESRPCKPGDVEPVSLSEWAGDPVIADLERFEGNGESQGKLGRHTPSKSLLLFQRALIQWGCQSASPGRNPLPQYGADGVHGKEFQRGVRQFQREEKLASDGAAGPATVRAMAVELYGINLRQDVEREQEAAFQQQSGGDVPANSFIEERLLEWCDLDLLPERFCRNL